MKGVPINDEEEVEEGESSLNFSRGKLHAAFLSKKSSLDHFLGEKKAACFLQTVNRL